MNYDPVATGDCNTKTDDQGATGVWLERTADGLALVADSEDICIISDDLADRSKCLVTARAASSVGDQVPLALDKRLLLLWHSFASGLDSVYTMDVQDLCNAVKVDPLTNQTVGCLARPLTTASRTSFCLDRGRAWPGATSIDLPHALPPQRHSVRPPPNAAGCSGVFSIVVEWLCLAARARPHRRMPHAAPRHSLRQVSPS